MLLGGHTCLLNLAAGGADGLGEALLLGDNLRKLLFNPGQLGRSLLLALLHVLEVGRAGLGGVLGLHASAFYGDSLSALKCEDKRIVQ